MKGLDSLWYNSSSVLARGLRPLSYLYQVGQMAHARLYDLGFKPTTHFAVPIIVVGNLTVGGTGKTPLVIALVEFLKQQGYRPGVVSRGYRSKVGSYPQWVDARGDAHLLGDEPVLIAQRTQCPVVIDPNRPRAVRWLLAHSDCNIVVSDDGLQHYALARDIEILVIDGERRFGNGFCLPAGPLREPLKRAQSVDFIVTNGQPQAGEFAMSLSAGAIRNLYRPEVILDSSQVKQAVHAVAGIANPARFFNQLRNLGFNLVEHVFPDHHPFCPIEIDFGKDALVIMTEKDAVKCRAFADERHWVLPTQANCEQKFLEDLMKKLGAKNRKVDHVLVE